MNCPKCRVRQLDDNLRCVDCYTQWTQKQLDFFEKHDAILLEEYNKEIAFAARTIFEKRVRLLKDILKIE